jgi:hypothetical protein
MNGSAISVPVPGNAAHTRDVAPSVGCRLTDVDITRYALTVGMTFGKHSHRVNTRSSTGPKGEQFGEQFVRIAAEPLDVEIVRVDEAGIEPHRGSVD